MHAHGLLACLPSFQRNFLTCLPSVVLISFDAECDVEGIIIVGRISNQMTEGGVTASTLVGHYIDPPSSLRDMLTGPGQTN